MKNQNNEAEFFKYLGQSTRLRILQTLRDGEKNVSEIQSTLNNIPQGRLSTHLG
jgi:DNA-binding HxlR family transcriptional regulator